MSTPSIKHFETCVREGHQPVAVAVFHNMFVTIETPWKLPLQQVPGVGTIRPIVNACKRCGMVYAEW